jgi:hypothetical protein
MKPRVVVAMQPLLDIPGLSKSECKTIVIQQLKEYRKRLTAEQLELLLDKAESSKPLYLLTCCEELRYVPCFPYCRCCPIFRCSSLLLLYLLRALTLPLLLPLLLPLPLPAGCKRSTVPAALVWMSRFASCLETSPRSWTSFSSEWSGKTPPPASAVCSDSSSVLFLFLFLSLFLCQRLCVPCFAATCRRGRRRRVRGTWASSFRARARPLVPSLTASVSRWSGETRGTCSCSPRSALEASASLVVHHLRVATAPSDV